MGYGLVDFVKSTAKEVAASDLAKDASAALQTAAADKAALEIDKVFGADKDFLNQSQVTVPSPDPELSKVKAPSEEAENAESKRPKWLIPAVVVFVVLTVVMFFFGGRKGGTKGGK